MGRVLIGAVGVAVGAAILTGCGGSGDPAPQAEPATTPSTASADAASEATAETTEEPAPPEPTSEEPTTREPTSEEPEATPEGPDTFQVGDLIERPTADLVVNVLEERDSIPASSTFHYASGKIEPGDGERLWYVDITWTNNLPEAVSKECHGPYSMRLSAFDLQGREMLMADQPGMIEGQECSTGLMQGQTGTWLSAFHGLDEEFGWLVFDDYNGEPAVVALNPDLNLTYQNRR